MSHRRQARCDRQHEKGDWRTDIDSAPGAWPVEPPTRCRGSPIRRGRNQGRSPSAARRSRSWALRHVRRPRPRDVLSGNCLESRGRPRRKPRPHNSQIVMVSRVW